MSNICETRSDLIKKLQAAVDVNASKEQNRLDKLWDDLQQNKTTFETVIFTLNRCLDTSNLDLYFGNKTQMYSKDLMDSINEFNRSQINTLPNIDWDHYNHPKFIGFINEITTSVLGDQYTYHKSNSDGWTSTLFIDDLTIVEKLKYDDFRLFKENWIIFVIFLPIALLIQLLCIIVYLFDTKLSLKCRNL